MVTLVSKNKPSVNGVESQTELPVVDSLSSGLSDFEFSFSHYLKLREEKFSLYSFSSDTLNEATRTFNTHAKISYWEECIQETSSPSSKSEYRFEMKNSEFETFDFAPVQFLSSPNLNPEPLTKGAHTFVVFEQDKSKTDNVQQPKSVQVSPIQNNTDVATAELVNVSSRKKNTHCPSAKSPEADSPIHSGVTDVLLPMKLEKRLNFKIKSSEESVVYRVSLGGLSFQATTPQFEWDLQNFSLEKNDAQVFNHQRDDQKDLLLADSFFKINNQLSMISQFGEDTKTDSQPLFSVLERAQRTTEGFKFVNFNTQFIPREVWGLSTLASSPSGQFLVSAVSLSDTGSDDSSKDQSSHEGSHSNSQEEGSGEESQAWS